MLHPRSDWNIHGLQDDLRRCVVHGPVRRDFESSHCELNDQDRACIFHYGLLYFGFGCWDFAVETTC